MKYIFCLYLLLFFSCQKEARRLVDTEKQLDYCHQQILRSLPEFPNRVTVPRFIEKEGSEWEMVCPNDWTSGFWPGILWYDYEHTKNAYILEYADHYTELLRPLSQTDCTHDIGFQMICSFGHAYRLTGNEKYKQPLLDGAIRLADWFNPQVGTILSWPYMVSAMNWPHNTIIDNMMNLELLFWAAKNGGEQRCYDIAVSHADVTRKNHFREDHSCYHVAVYDTITGNLIKGITHQGLHDGSMWARGQAWAIYGFTMVYRETGENRFLETAHKAAEIYLNRLPDDRIPYWDFDAPHIPETPRDASAAAIVASALLELSTYTEENKLSDTYKNEAIKMLEILSSENYQSGASKSSFLKHSTGHYPNGYEIDASINYADYYYIEALTRLVAP